MQDLTVSQAFTALTAAIARTAREGVQQTCAAIDARVLEPWQQWSDTTFADVQPCVAAIASNLLWLVMYVAAFLYQVSLKVLRDTFESWKEGEIQRVLWMSVTVSFQRARAILQAVSQGMRWSVRTTGKVLRWGFCLTE